MGIQGILLEKCHEKSEVLAIIKKHDGKISYIAKELGCHHDTIYKYFERNPDVKEFREQVQKDYLDKRLDVCESVLDILVAKVHEDPGNALKSTIYTLNNLGKTRNYAHEASKAAVATAEYQQELMDATRDPLNKSTPQ